MRSPMASMSSSSCFWSLPLAVFFMVFMSMSVVLPMAETTTAILVPFFASFATAFTALASFSWSARLEPPNLTTIFLREFSFFINSTILAPRNLVQKFLSGLGLVKIVIKLIAEAKELRRPTSFSRVICHCSFEPVE